MIRVFGDTIDISSVATRPSQMFSLLFQGVFRDFLPVMNSHVVRLNVDAQLCSSCVHLLVFFGPETTGSQLGPIYSITIHP